MRGTQPALAIAEAVARATAMPAAGAAASAASASSSPGVGALSGGHASSRQVRQTTIVTGPDEAGRASCSKGLLALTHRTPRSSWGAGQPALPRRAETSNRPRAPRPDPARLADGRSPGSRVIAGAPPSRASPSGFRSRLVAYSCGDSCGLEPCLVRTAFPLRPLRCRRRTVAVDVTRRSARLSTRPAPVCGRSNIRL